jgi:tRNA modification GTPase
VSQILEALASTGARFAKPGEFTYRAFNNGNLDLIQAESIIGIIHSNSKKAASQALRQLSGDLSKQISIIENELISCLAHIEASIDFSTEGLDILSDGKILSKLKSISESINKLVSGYRSGRVIKDGLKVVLSGRPNVGKSSLLNLLLGEDKAIVTELAGTTRDLVEGALFVDGIKVNLIDTAGIRDSLDKVEKLGIQKSLIVRAESDVVIYVIDGLCGFTDEDDEQLRSLDTEQLIILVNKLDLMTESQSQVILNQIKSSNFFNTKSLKSNFLNERVLLVSALDKRSIDSISKLVMSVVRASGFQDDSLISQARHYEGLVKSLNLIQSSIEGLNSNAGVEYIAFDLKEALIHLQGVMGKVFDDQIMDRVFKEFCIGK